MSNSSLATSHYWAKNKSSRNGQKIKHVIIHHMAGNLDARGCYNVWKSRQGSAHYCISKSGQIGQCVDEAYRAWSVANAKWDSKSVAIECANSSGSPSWKVSDATIKSLIKLVADICKRNGIKKCTYTGDTSGTLLMHCWFMSTNCPGPYLKKQFSYIAKEVNKILGAKTTLTVDGIFGAQSISRAQEVFNTPVDGRISGQIKDNYKFFTGIPSKQIDFGAGSSSLIKAIQKKVGVKQTGRLTRLDVVAIQKWLGVEDANGYWKDVTSKSFQRWLNKQK